jgi:hypothetical protein
MLTPRERATSAYRAAVAQGRSRIFGVDDMVSVTEARLANVQQAQRAITQASAAERHFHSEPDDARLDQMRDRMDSPAAALEGDQERWATR